MKKAQSYLAFLLAVVLMMSFAAGCTKPPKPNEENPLLGEWKDQYGLTEYQFLENNQLKMVTIGLATFSGTYTAEGDQITISISMLGAEVEEKTYTYQIEDDKLYLDDEEFIRKTS